MADNVTLPGASEVIATDDIGGVQYQRTKITDGLADSTTHMRVLSKNPLFTDAGAVVRQAPCDIWSVGFAASGSSLLAAEFTQRRLGTGVGVTQGSSNLLITTGTTANSEFLARSTQAFMGAFTARAKTILSQRIANNNFVAMLADRVGEGLSCTINSATSITVTKTAHGLTAENVGQFMFVGAITGANGVPGRYAIASVPSVDTINFTVAGWPASGSCTVDLFGWNYIRTLYTGTTATSASVDAQRRGWNSGDTTATINTTASAGHVIQMYTDGRNVSFSDALVASSTTPTVTTRASRIENIPDDDVELYFYLWSFNGATAPASTTTWTVGFVAVEDTVNAPTFIAGVRPLGAQAALPVTFPAAQAVTVSSGTVTATVANATIAAGTAAIGDVGVQYRGSATGAGTPVNLNCPATPAAQAIKASAGRLLKLFAANSNAAGRFAKIFNTASGSVVMGTTSAVLDIPLPPNNVPVMIDLGEGGAGFATAISIAITGARGLTDNTTVTLNDVTGFLTNA